MNKNKQTIVLFILALVFVAPGLAAYLFYQHPSWLNSKTTNKGQLLNPPVLFSALDNQQAKWRLLLWNPQSCHTTCLKQIDKLARIRLALGRRLYNVEQWVVIGQAANAFPQGMINALTEQDIHYWQAAAQPKLESILGSQAQVFIVSPENYLVLTYPLSANSADIYHDLKQLTTDKKSG